MATYHFYEAQPIESKPATGDPCALVHLYPPHESYQHFQECIYLAYDDCEACRGHGRIDITGHYGYYNRYEQCGKCRGQYEQNGRYWFRYNYDYFSCFPSGKEVGGGS